MGHGLHDLARHNAWATGQVLAFCRGLDGSTLGATVPGTYGTIIETLRHMINAEASYLFRLTGAWPAHPWRGDAAVGLDVLAERAAVLATTLERFLVGDFGYDDVASIEHGDPYLSCIAGVERTVAFLRQVL